MPLRKTDKLISTLQSQFVNQSQELARKRRKLNKNERKIANKENGNHKIITLKSKVTKRQKKQV